MCFCCSHRQTWKLQLEVISEEGKIERYSYQVEVKAERASLCCCDCCQNGIHTLTVNQVQVEEKLYDNLCFPLCCSGGDFEWQEKGHFFRIELPSLFIHQGLYVDGKELQTKRLNTYEWKCQFMMWILLGMFVSVLGLVFIGINQSKCCWRGFLYLGISCLITGFLTQLPGIIGCARATSLSRQYKKIRQAQLESQREYVTSL